MLTVKGVQNWYQAEEGNTIYETLRIDNGGLELWQMNGILEWIPQFRDEIVNKLEKSDMNLPMEPFALGQTLAFSLGLGGGALAGGIAGSAIPGIGTAIGAIGGGITAGMGMMSSDRCCIPMKYTMGMTIKSNK